MRAGEGLGVKAALKRVLVIGFAGITRLKACHGGVFPVIGQFFDGAIPRAALGATGKWIKIKAAVGVEQVVNTVGADAVVRRNVSENLDSCAAFD